MSATGGSKGAPAEQQSGGKRGWRESRGAGVHPAVTLLFGSGLRQGEQHACFVVAQLVDGAFVGFYRAALGCH